MALRLPLPTMVADLPQRWERLEWRPVSGSYQYLRWGRWAGRFFGGLAIVGAALMIGGVVPLAEGGAFVGGAAGMALLAHAVGSSGLDLCRAGIRQVDLLVVRRSVGWRSLTVEVREFRPGALGAFIVDDSTGRARMVSHLIRPVAGGGALTEAFDEVVASLRALARDASAAGQPS